MEVIPLGGAGTVTGSRFLIHSGSTGVLVDCGMFQGLKQLRLRNWRPFPIPPRELDAIVLTHAHLDHSGFLPVLVRDGFEGRVHVTPPTRDLLPILLSDAGRIQEEDAEWARRKGFSKHDPPRPLFTERDAARVQERVDAHPFHAEWRVGPLTFSFFRAGHILGAASLLAREDGGRSVLFSGDLGRPGTPLLPGPEPRPGAELVVMESTYGDRLHPEESAADALERVVGPTLRRGGVVMIPSFALGRAQEISLLLHRLIESGRIPEVPVYLNSPMALRVSEVHRQHLTELLPAPEEMTCALDRVVPVASVDESRELNGRRGPMVIIAGAGMLSGGRILHHLRVFGLQRLSTLILVGYQAEGTRGRRLRGGDRTVRVHGGELKLECGIEFLDVLSGHADRDELTGWLGSGPLPESGVALVHGEPGPADALRLHLEVKFGIRVQVAEEGVPIDPSAPGRLSPEEA